MTLRPRIESEPLPGVYVLKVPVFEDERGAFAKPFNRDCIPFSDLGLNVAEHFYSRSKYGVLRGMHFQDGNAAHEKLVFCANGEVLDVIVDVRLGSPLFNRPFSIRLSGNNSTAVFVGKGYAHGFLSLSECSEVHYLVSKAHVPESDKGVLWSSINYEWPIEQPILSMRDMSHPPIGGTECEFS